MPEDDKETGDEGWLADFCDLPTETLVTPSGTRKLPGRPRYYVNGDASLTLSREDYQAWTLGLINYAIDPCLAWAEMGHKIECEDE